MPVPVAAAVQGLRWLALRPVKTGLLLTGAALWWWAGWWATVLLAAGTIFVAIVASSPGSRRQRRLLRAYRRCQLRGRVRRSWPKLMAETGLINGDGEPMRHGRITATSTGLATTVANGSAARTADQVRDAAPVIAGMLDVHSVRARRLDSARTRLTIHQVDPLSPIIKLSELPVITTGSRVCIGLSDEGEPVVTSMSTGKLLLGLPGAGKSSIIWTLVAGVQHWTDQPVPLFHVVDLKGGVELGALSADRGGIAADFTKDPRQAERLTHDLVRDGDRRLALMEERDWRRWKPAYAEVLGPRRFLLLDEFLALPPKMTQAEKSPLRELLYRLPATGINVIGASQLTQVEPGAVGRLRNLFADKILLAMESQGMTQAAASSSSEAPAHLLRLPQHAGRFFLVEEGRSGWVAGKAAFVDDEAGEHLPIARGEVR